MPTVEAHASQASDGASKSFIPAHAIALVNMEGITPVVTLPASVFVGPPPNPLADVMCHLFSGIAAKEPYSTIG